jgi:hypothetical protein
MTSTPTRRTVTRAAAWTAPMIAVSVAAPAFATSTRKDPGINGWVQVGTDEVNNQNGTYDVEFDSTVNGVGPDGSPYGLYLYDVNVSPADKFQNAKMTFWLNDTQSSVVPSTLTGHGAAWLYAGTVGSQTKPDGFSYTGYLYTYNAPILAAAYDGTRLFLQDLHINLRANQVSNDAQANMTYWVERSIEIQTNGVGAFVPKSFQRRNGQRGPLGNGFPGGGSLQRLGADAGLPV